MEHFYCFIFSTCQCEFFLHFLLHIYTTILSVFTKYKCKRRVFFLLFLKHKKTVVVAIAATTEKEATTMEAAVAPHQQLPRQWNNNHDKLCLKCNKWHINGATTSYQYDQFSTFSFDITNITKSSIYRFKSSYQNAIDLQH